MKLWQIFLNPLITGEPMTQLQGEEGDFPLPCHGLCWKGAGYKRPGNLCQRFRPVVTFEAGWSDWFFCSLAWPPAWFRQESSVQRRGAGTSARPNSKKRNLFQCLHIICRSSYKCGVFFKDLSPKVPLAWLGALPEAVVSAQKEEIEE